MTIVSLYARVSSKEQKQELKKLEYRIIEDGYELLDEYRFIDKDSNSGLKSLCDKVAKGGIDKIYLCSPGHLSHKFADQVILVEEFRKAGVEVILLDCKIDGSLESHLLWKMQGIVAEYKHRKTIEQKS